MKIVIDIPEDTYNYMISRCKYQNKDDSGLSEFEKAGIAIKNGTLLPKGHGDLKDVDKLKNAFIKWIMAVQGSFTDSDIASIVYNSPTIIEADKEGEQK